MRKYIYNEIHEHQKNFDPENPNVLYYAGFNSNEPPLLYRLDNAHEATSGAVDISPPGLPSGAYPLDIALNPFNANEVILVMSNYSITGLYHSLDGGASWQAIEGNLTGTSGNPGPSLRAATILPPAST